MVVHSTQVYILLKPLFSRHKGIGVQFTDEPTGNLDEDTAREIIELIKKTAHELGKCVIVVTHSKQLAEEADVVLAINQGILHEQECLKENLLEKF
jgi:putative ABC transport system ATP-binding protein